MRHFVNWLRVPRTLSLSVLTSLLAATAMAQTLVTDKDDYRPGETVYFAGSGFQPGENVALALKVENYTDVALDYAIGGIVVDSMGEFTATWLVPQEALNTLITATAVGLSSRKVAMATFTDHDDLLGGPNVYSPSLSANGDVLTITGSVSALDGFGRGGGYVNTDSVRAFLNRVSGSGPEFVIVPLSFQSVAPDGVVRVGCCFASGAHGLATFQGAVELPCDNTYLLRSIQFQQGLWGLGRCISMFPTFGGTFRDPLGNIIPAPTASTSSCVTCPTNTAPTLDLDDLDLGELVGCLTANGFQKDVTVAAADFNPVADDADGDPVTVAFQGPTNITFTGPGHVSAMVTFTATDDPSARNVQGCPTLVAESVTRTAHVTAQIVYDFDGLQTPMMAGEVLLNKQGRVIPLKFTLRDCSGLEVNPDNSALGSDEANTPWLAVKAVTTMTPDTGPVVDDPGMANDNGTEFQYSRTPGGGDGKWIYRLATKGQGWTSGVLYRIDVTLNDGTVRDFYFSLKR